MDSETQAPLKASDPRMVAWKQYIASEEYANAKRWAVLPEHAEGSMWAAFLAGWETRPAAPHAAPREGEPTTLDVPLDFLLDALINHAVEIGVARERRDTAEEKRNQDAVRSMLAHLRAALDAARASHPEARDGE